MISKTSLAICAGLAVVGLAGCATPFRAPPDVTHIQLERTDSSVVRVAKIWLERKQGPLLVRGYVNRRVETADTSGIHLDVILYDATGRVLRSTVGAFTPKQIQHQRRHPDSASYQVALDPLPPETTRIEVRAHEGPHS